MLPAEIDSRVLTLDQRADLLISKAKPLLIAGLVTAVVCAVMWVLYFQAGADVTGFDVQLPPDLRAIANKSDGALSAAITSPFSDSLDAIVSISDGSLGLIVSLSAILIGVGMGIVNQSITATVAGLSFAILINYGPRIVVEMVTQGDRPTYSLEQSLQNLDVDHVKKLFAESEASQLHLNFLLLQLSILNGKPLHDLYDSVVYSLRYDSTALGIQPDGHVAYGIEMTATGEVKSAEALAYQAERFHAGAEYRRGALITGIISATVNVSLFVFGGLALHIRRRVGRIRKLKERVDSRSSQFAGVHSASMSTVVEAV